MLDQEQSTTDYKYFLQDPLDQKSLIPNAGSSSKVVIVALIATRHIWSGQEFSIQLAKFGGRIFIGRKELQ